MKQCLMCKYVFGRTCKANNQIISDDIYYGKLVCSSFKSIQDESIDYPNDSCCNENKSYYEDIKDEKEI